MINSLSLQSLRMSIALDPDREHILLLRSTEWANWPLFVLQPIVPVALLFVPWWIPIVGVLALSYAWILARNRYHSLRLTLLGSLFVRFKWAVSIVMALVFLIMGQFIQAAFSILWPLITMLLMLFIPVTDVKPIQDRLRDQLLVS